jgi:enediyne biosynthesis protein E4
MSARRHYTLGLVIYHWSFVIRHCFRLFVILFAAGLSGAATQSATNQAITSRDLQITNHASRITNHVSGFTLLPPERTGVTFINHLHELASAENRVLNNGSGVAAGDFDNDGLPDLFFSSLNNQNALYKNLGDWRFTNVTAQAGLKFGPAFYRAAVFADVNGDGALDLVVGTVGKGVLCFLNDGRGHFTDVTPQAGTASAYATESVALADIDGDGALDLYVTNNRTDDIRDWPRIPVVMVNKKPTVPPALRDRITFESGQLQEFGEPHFLYRNTQGGAKPPAEPPSVRFSAVSWTNGAFLGENGKALEKAPADWGLTAAFRDLDGDGVPDLYVCNDYWTPDRVWMNAGDGHFRAIDPLAIRKICASSMGVDFADINHDGHLDIFAVDMLSRSLEVRKRQVVAKRLTPPRVGDIETRVQTPQNTLLLNRGDGTYAEIAQLAGVHASEWSWSPVFIDVDLDGHDDLLITTGHIRDIQDLDANEHIKKLPDTWRRNAQGAELQRAFTEAKREHTKLYPYLDMPVIAFRNLGNLRFEEVTRAWGFNHPAVNHGIALADFDGDGDLDAVVNRLGAYAAVYRNDSTAPRVAVRLRGQPPNTKAIGASIELIGGPVPNQKVEVTSGGSYLSGSDTVRVFAAGTNSANLSLRIRWRSGHRTEVPDIKPNRLYEIREEPPQRHRDTETKTPAPFPLRASVPLWFEDVSNILAHTHHEEPFNDFERQPLLPRKLSQNGPGLTWFDLNADGWDDLLIGSGKGGQMAVLINKEGKTFERLDQAPFNATTSRDQTTILAFRALSNSIVLFGAANYEDAATNVPSLTHLSFDRHSSFSTASLLHNFASSVGPMALADIDADGDLDLFVGGQVIPGRYPEPASSTLLRQQDGKWQVDSTNSKVLASIGLVNAAVWSDLDGDRLPELLLACEWGPIRVLRNEGGKLTLWNPAVTHHASRIKSFNQLTGLWTGIATGDFDADGRLDILAGNWGFNSENVATAERPLTLLFGDLGELNRVDIIETEFDPVRRQLSPRLQRDALGAGLPFVHGAFPTHEAYSKATLKDVLHPRRAFQFTASTLATTLFLNRGGSFEARELPLEAQFAPAFSVQIADFDGDGHEDAFLSQNFFAFPREEQRLDSGRGLLLRGDGRGNLDPVPGQVSGIKVYGEQRAAAVADFDKDGRVDLAVTQNGAATRLYRNTAARPGLRIRFEGSPGNSDGIGALIRLRYTQNERGPAREIQAGSGYWSQNSSVQVLGVAKPPTALEVRWPDGRKSETPIPTNATELLVRP